MSKLKRIASCLILGAFIASLCACGSENQSSKNSEVYGATIGDVQSHSGEPNITLYDDAIRDFDDDVFYAVVETNASSPVLLVTSQVYDDGLGNQAALWCDVYYMVDGIVKNTGQIESMGTAYPIAYDETGIYGVSGQDIECFSINEREGTLQLSEGASEQYHGATIVSFTQATSNANQ
jgi:hypothetical protein